MKISYRNLKRYKEIAYVLIKYGFSFIVEKLNIENVAYKIPITNPSQEIKDMSTGEKIRHVMEELGPTYVKLGQILSTRKDLLDQDIIDELSKLRDSVEPFDTQVAKEIFYKETKLHIDKVFTQFNEIPIAAASIGQVYEARLKNGEEVIIKIQRPDIDSTIKSDMEILRKIAAVLEDKNKDIDIELSKVVEEFNTQLIRELDYNFEAINAMKFKKIFKDTEDVYIPTVYDEYTTKRILVMEKIIGIKLSDINAIKKMGWNTGKISDIGVKALLKQIFEHGFFHADPHPGNIFVVSRNCISYIDFGMVGIIDNKSLEFLNQITIAIAQKNINKVIYLMKDMNMIHHNVDLNSLKQDLLYLIHYYYDVPIDKIRIGDILNEVFRFLRKNKISIPTELSMLGKTIITLEGTGRQLNPNFSIALAVQDFAKYYYLNKINTTRILMDSKNEIEEVLLDIKSIPKQFRKILNNIENNNIKIELEEIKFTKLERCIMDLATKLSLSLVLAALIVGSSLIISSPNINQNIWVKMMAIGGFFASFAIGLLLVIKIFRTHFRK